MRRALLVIATALVVLAFGASYHLQKLSRVDLNPVEAINSTGQVVYAGVGGMLNIYNIYQRDFPQLMGTVEGHSSRIKSIIVDGNKLYVLWEKEGLVVYDITDPYTPTELGRFPDYPDDRFKSFNTMDLDGNTIYLAGKDYLAALDVSNPEDPVVVNFLELNGAPLKIDYYDHKIFAAAGKLGLGVFWTPSPDRIYLYGTQKGVYTTVRAYRDLIFYGRLDESRPGEETLFPHLFSFPFVSPQTIRFRGDYIFAGGMANFATYKIVPTQKDPVLLWSKDGLPTVDCVLKDDNIYLANSWEGLSVFDISDVENPFEIGRVRTSDVPQRGCAVDNKFFVAAGRSGVIAIDFSSPETPMVVARFGADKLHTVWDVKYHNGSLFVLGAREAKSSDEPNIFLEQYDIKGDHIAEYPVCNVKKLDPIGEIAFGEGYVAVSLGSEGIQILRDGDLKPLYRITDPDVQFCDLAIRGGLLYASDYVGGYQIWRLGEDGAELVGSIKTSEKGGNGIALVGKYLLAADGPNGLVVIDIRNPEAPRLVNSYPSVWGTDIWVDGDFAYMSDGQGGMKVFDISHLPEVSLVDELPRSGYWTHIYGANGLIFGVDAYAGVYVYTLRSDEETLARKAAQLPETEILGAYPNPFNAATAITFSIAGRTDVELSIFDMSGRRVATLIHDVLPAGKYTLRWNAKDAPTGTYFAVLKTSTSTSKQRLELVK